VSDNSPETPEPAAPRPEPQPEPAAPRHVPAAPQHAPQPEPAGAQHAPAEKPVSTRFAVDEPAAKPKSRRLSPVIAVVAALLVGAGAAAGGLYQSGWRRIPEEKYTMVVILKDDTGQPQKDQIKKVLETLPGRSEIRLVGRAEAFAEAKTAYASNPEALAGLKEENMPESFRLTVVERGFDCTPLKPLGGNPAISKMSVVKPYGSESDPGADILC
jgi:hypothetical protein